MKATLLALVAPCILLLACTGGTDDGALPEDATPTPEPSPNLSPTVGGVEAMRRYLTETGLDGHMGSLTDPINCARLSDRDDIEGDFCIIDDAGIYAPGLVILFVADAQSIDKKAWQVHLNRGESAWEVVDVDFIGTE